MTVLQHTIIFGILLTLLNKKRVTRQQLAEKYELSIRTISRYIEILEQNNIPIESKQGVDGGLSIYDEFCLRQNFLTKEEKTRLLLCVNAMSNTFSDPLQEALSQKLVYNKEIDNKDVEILKTESIYIDINNWTNPHFYRKKLSIFNELITTATKVSFYYTDRYSTKTNRIVHPYTLVLKDGAWYLFGFCEIRNDYRLFRLSRIQNISTLSDRFEKNTEIDVAKYLSGDFDSVTEIDLKIEFGNLVYQEIEEWLGGDSIKQHDLLFTAQATVYNGSKLVQKLLSFGSDVKVLHPISLANEIRLEANRMLGLYS